MWFKTREKCKKTIDHLTCDLYLFILLRDTPDVFLWFLSVCSTLCVMILWSNCPTLERVDLYFMWQAMMSLLLKQCSTKRQSSCRSYCPGTSWWVLLPRVHALKIHLSRMSSIEAQIVLFPFLLRIWIRTRERCSRSFTACIACSRVERTSVSL